MREIIVDGLSIEVTQTVTGVRLINPRAVERTDDGIQWGGSVTLLSNGNPIGNRTVREAIQKNTSMSFVELNTHAQASLSKDYVDLTVGESQQIQGEVLATKMITAINATDSGIGIDDVQVLVMAIVSALA